MSNEDIVDGLSLMETEDPCGAAANTLCGPSARVRPTGIGSRPTVYDVAGEAGVSIATVSRVVNSTAVVAAHTRERVERAVSKLGYVPNPQAQALRSAAVAKPMCDGVSPQSR